MLVYSLSRSPLLTSLVAALEALPYLMFGLPAGALADRFNRKRVMVARRPGQRASYSASIPIAYWFGALTVPHLLVAAFVVPALFVFFDAADFGALPTLVGRDRIAVGQQRAVVQRARWSRRSCRSLAAALFAVISPASLIAVDALSYVASAVLIRADRAAAVRRRGSWPRRCPGRRWSPTSARAWGSSGRT